MSIIKRLTAIIASGFALAATPEAQAFKTPSPLGPGRPTPGVPPPPQLADSPETTNSEPPPLELTPRTLIVFASGFALAAAAVVAVWMLPSADASLAPGKPKTTVAPPQRIALGSGQLATCPIEPAAIAASDKDGKFPLQTSVEGLIAADITSFIVIGNEAAAADRPRDAEAAFLMACRVADKLGGAGSIESADAKYQLGSHYAKLALGTAGANRAELLKRAEPLYRDSLQTSIAHHGKAHEKSQLAAQGLAAVKQTLAQGENVQPKPSSTTTTTTAPAPATATAIAPVPVPVPVLKQELVTDAGLKKLPDLPPPGAAAVLTLSPSPATDAGAKARQDLPVVKQCPEAVASLGLCNPVN